MKAEIVTSTARLGQIGPAWEQLVRLSNGRIFQSHGWVSAWWTAADTTSGLRLQIGLCWAEDGTLQAVIPCVTRPYRGMRVLEWAAKDCSDYCDAMVISDSTTALAIAWQAIVAAGGFSVVYLSHVRPDAALPRLLGESGTRASRLRLGHRTERTLQVNSNGHDGAGWFRTLSKKARNNHLRGKRHLEEFGAVRIGIVEPQHRAETVNQMVSLKSAWLATQGQRNSLFDRDACGLRAQIEVLAQQQALQVFAITCDGKLVAGLVNVVRDGQAAAFFSAFDGRYDRASPGTVVLVELLLWAFDHGIPEVDFLCGTEGYKLKFANRAVDLVSYVGARTGIGHAALLISEWADASRQRREARMSEAVPQSITTAAAQAR